MDEDRTELHDLAGKIRIAYARSSGNMMNGLHATKCVPGRYPETVIKKRIQIYSKQ